MLGSSPGVMLTGSELLATVQGNGNLLIGKAYTAMRLIQPARFTWLPMRSARSA